MKLKFILSVLLLINLLISCNQEESKLSCVENGTIAYAYTDPDGNKVEIYSNGDGYYVNDNKCTFVAKIFDPNFFQNNYIKTEDGIRLIVDANTLFEPFKSFELDAESASEIQDVFIQNVAQRDRVFNTMTLQSPSTPTIDEYVALSHCIFDMTCDFIDNRFDISQDPIDASNTVLKFYSVPPSANMITAKTSVATTLAFFQAGEDFWYEAMYYLEDGRPTTLADFESSYFEGSQGPRVIFRGDKLAIENKFGNKMTFEQPVNQAVSFPMNQWVKIKVHLKYSTTNGIIQVWQDDQLLIDTTGRNIPFDFWVQNRLEIGITATQEKSTVYMDNIRFSDASF